MSGRRRTEESTGGSSEQIRAGVRAARREVRAAMAMLLVFLMLTVLVHLRLLARADLEFSLALQDYTGPILDAAATATGIMVAGQTTVLYALAGCLLLWRRGFGIWSLAPMTFLLGTVLEVAMKLTIHQPGVPHHLHRNAYYPFTSVDLLGAFPSGHALRTAFLCVFVAVLLWHHDGRWWRVGAIGMVALALFMGFTRIYVGDHWLSDVVAGLLLGSALALLVAPPIARKLKTRS